MTVAAVTRRLLSLSQSLVLGSRLAVAGHTPPGTLAAAGRRGTACSLSRALSSGTGARRAEDKVTVHFVNRDGEKITVQGNTGDSLLDVVIDKNLDFDGFGACEGTLACSTCHLIFEKDVYKQLGPITDEEMDMLDLAYGLTDTSRLGCQICLSKSLDGMTVKVPESVSDVRQSVDVGTTTS
ncbi:adrenodoxin [Lepisosteus oculatus]|uniref:adrenodoxin n=1 Tax=Lepisosteus oculatus TaxID=7918 RepID=UPI00073FBE03|nr:PREDICTED: adrenodoxin, mitochondrial isoform X2 [Lepisosteus oculatus]